MRPPWATNGNRPEPPEMGSLVAVVLPGAGMVKATVTDVRFADSRTCVRVVVEGGREIEFPLGAVQPLS